METSHPRAGPASPSVAARQRHPWAPLRFYFTIHPSDASRQRLLPGCHVMLVAAAHWDATRQRFRVRRPPADHVASLVVDSGGYTAARRWGRYPWSPRQYADFVRAVSRDIPLDWCATMDYACEPSVDRSTLATNQARIDATLTNERTCLEADATLPWLQVLQGDTLAERAYDLTQRQRLGLVPTTLAGVGSVCGRGAAGAVRVVRWYATHLPGVQYHAFGLDARALDDDDVAMVVQSWDSYAWNWPKGRRGQGLALVSLRRVGETYTQYVRRLAGIYWTQTIQPRLVRPRQLRLPLGVGSGPGYDLAGRRGAEMGHILLWQLDGRLPNLALMRIAAHHRALGDTVELRRGSPRRLLWDQPTHVYGSLLFTRSRPLGEQLRALYPNAILGGTGWDGTVTLAQAGIPETGPVDYAMYPDYPHSIGFTQRGCRLHCPFCVVPRKEGRVQPVATIAELWRGVPWPRHILLLDNDFFGAPHWVQRVGCQKS